MFNTYRVQLVHKPMPHQLLAPKVTMVRLATQVALGIRASCQSQRMAWVYTQALACIVVVGVYWCFVFVMV